MKKKILTALGLAAIGTFALAGLTSCGKKPILIWVGTESQAFYQEQLEVYKADYKTANGEDFPYVIEVKGVDTGGAASTFIDDTEAGADILTIAHDNLGKVVAGSSVVAPITDGALLKQIEDDNPAAFKDVIKNTVNGKEYTFAVPYISQALVLYYNTDILNAEDVKTFEGIAAKAKANNMQSVSMMGADGYNASWPLLATPTAEGSKSTLQIYENGVQEACNATGDDTLAKLHWAQRFFGNKNGAKYPSDSGWEVEIKNGVSASLVGGAWSYSAAKSALGTKLGISILPTFKITAEDAVGTCVEGTEFRAGTFADCKVLVMKKDAGDKAKYLQDIMRFMSSKAVQEKSFEKCQNLPSYKNASTEFAAMQGDSLEAQLASCQIEMSKFGIAQPFGYQTRFNTYFYSKGTPELIQQMLENKDGLFATKDQIKKQMETVVQIWKTGEKPA